LKKMRDDRGAAVVEFVLVAQLLFLLLFGLVDVAMLLNTKLVMIHAAREGLRVATIEGGAAPEAYEEILDQLQLGALDEEQADVRIRPKHASYGTRIHVTVDYQFRVFTPVLRLLAGHHVPLSIELVGRSERLR